MAENNDETKPAQKGAARWSKGRVNVVELRIGTRDSDSVRRLQHALGVEVTGNYDESTRRAVQRAQIKSGYAHVRGNNPNARQAREILGDDYSVVTE